MPSLLHNLLLTSATESPDALALIHKKNQYSYSKFTNLVEQHASALISCGLSRQDRVAVYLPKQPETASMLFAITMAGGVFVPVNPALRSAQVSHILNDCDVRILITSASRLTSLANVLNECPHLHTIIVVDDVELGHTDYPVTLLSWSQFTERASIVQYPHLIDTDMAAILYTSGSTGKPKGVVLSHLNMVTGADSVAQYLNNTSSDRLLAALPFSFDYGLSQLTTAILSGACCVLMEYLLPRDVIRALVTHRITGLAAVPPLWIQLANLEWPESINEHLRYFTNSGGKMPRATLNTLRQHVPDAKPFLMYGLTEAFRSTFLPPDLVDQHPDSIGKAIPNAEVMVVRKDGTPCEPEEPGELVHRGSLVALGYWNDTEKTAQRFKPCPNQTSGLPITEIAVWSGDTVKLDKNGLLYFVGRDDEMIKTSGYRVSPTEVEEMIYTSGLVKEAVVLGITHHSLGQAIVVVAVSAEQQNTEPEHVLNYCRTELPTFMVPSKVLIYDELPRNPNGKIDRNTLKDNLSDIFEHQQT
ncbi:MAG: acyl-CoA ligase (AMP-forming), exosortase A system-associated [Gammaproteobacteria bacterium]|nr:acyl-CoA ligase (AMP-forming), exosortase A system-associated [Gammaproteobacteria bacterium]